MNSESFPVTAEFDKPREKCGVAGVYYFDNQNEAELLFMLEQLQHRGQEGAGIAMSDGQGFIEHTGLGKLPQAMKDDKNDYKGNIGVGHLRYSTVVDTKESHSALQPIAGRTRRNEYEFRLSHNGNIPFLAGISDSGASDTEMVTELLVESIDEGRSQDVASALFDVLPMMEGAYSFVIADDEKLIGVRDPRGIRPLVLGKSEKGYYLASETPALRVIGAEFMRDVEPGEVVTIDSMGVHSRKLPGSEEIEPAFCIMEHSYFARKDSMMLGESNYRRRVRMGEQLFREAPTPHADYVVGVPGTGLSAAIGYSRASGLPYEETIEKPTGTGRSFIGPDQAVRELIAQGKLFPVEDCFEGKSVVVVDDTVVRGTITRVLVKKLREVGAREIHFRVAAPPYKYSCHYGVDTGDERALIARERTVEEIKEYLGVDSLSYLSLTGFKQAIAVEGDPFCDACLTGDYPTPVPIQLGRTATQISN